MSIIDAPHRRQLRELALSVKDLINEIGPLAVTPEQEQAVARCWLALQAPAVSAIEALDQVHIPFNQAEIDAEKAKGGEPRSDARPPEIAPDAHLESDYEERYEVE